MKSHKRFPSIVEKAEKALKIAVAKALEDHRHKGFPIFVWQENKVVRIPAHRIRSR